MIGQTLDETRGLNPVDTVPVKTFANTQRTLTDIDEMKPTKTVATRVPKKAHTMTAERH